MNKLETLDERLGKLREMLRDNDFLHNRGLGNEVNIRLFQYNCKEEAEVRNFVRSLEYAHLPCTLHCFDLWETFLAICQNDDLLDYVDDLIETEGMDTLVESLQEAVSPDSIVEEFHVAELQVGKDVLLLYGVGSAFPFVRIHHLLQRLPNYCQVPVVVFYPGSVQNHELKLFDLLPHNSYYRCFTDI